MKTTINGKRYDSKKCEELAELDHYNNGNYSGTTYIERASDGQLLLHTISNGQDSYLTDAFYAPEGPINWEGYEMNEDQEKRCAELGLIEIVA